MQSGTKILLLIGALALLGLGALVVFDREQPLPEVDPGKAIVVNSGGVGEEPGAVDPRVAPEFAVLKDDPNRSKPVVDPQSGKGLISGRIGISTRVMDRLSNYTIVVQEDVNPNARKDGDPEPILIQRGFKADLSRGTPYFDIEDVPFSRHPYRVSVAAPGMNGSSAMTYVTAESPLGSEGDVQLTLTPGSFFSVMLRDQRQIPRRDLPVRLVPIGRTLVERNTMFGKTGNAGHFVFENVLAGDYEIHVGHANDPMAPPQKVTVYASLTTFDPHGRPQSQGTTIIVPDGHHVTIEVASRWGYYIENADLKAWQLEIKRYYEFKGKTDKAGRCVFENVPYGIYQLSIGTPNNGRKDLKFKVEKDKPAPVVKVTMHR